MVRVRPERSALEELLRRQVRYMVVSGAAFDAGDLSEAARLAVAMRVLLHDTGSSTSLLTQLGMKDSLRLLDTQHPYGVAITVNVDGELVNSGNRGIAHWSPLAHEPSWYAPLESLTQEPVWVTFEEWWRSPCITDDSGAVAISRWHLIDWMAHQDGGAHVDPRGLDERYARFIAIGDGSFWLNSVDVADGLPQELTVDDMHPVRGNGAACSVRQAAHELLRSMQVAPGLAGSCR